MKLSPTQMEALDSLLHHDNVGSLQRTMLSCRQGTVMVLVRLGLICRDYSSEAAARSLPGAWPRTQYYELTQRGKEVVREHRKAKQEKHTATPRGRAG